MLGPIKEIAQALMGNSLGGLIGGLVGALGYWKLLFEAPDCTLPVPCSSEAAVVGDLGFWVAIALGAGIGWIVQEKFRGS